LLPFCGEIKLCKKYFVVHQALPGATAAAVPPPRLVAPPAGRHGSDERTWTQQLSPAAGDRRHRDVTARRHDVTELMSTGATRRPDDTHRDARLSASKTDSGVNTGKPP